MTARLVPTPYPEWTWVERELGPLEVRGAVLVAGDEALVWDTLVEPADMAAVADLVTGCRVTVVYSHADWDHCWGTAGLAPFEVVAHAAAEDRFAREVPTTLAQFRAAESGLWDDVVLVPPTRLVGAREVLRIGGHTVELVAVPGHTPDCLIAWAPDWGVLLAGDVAEDPWPTVGDPSEVEAWAATLASWAGRPDVLSVVPGHGAVGDRTLLCDNAAYLHALVEGTVRDDLSAVVAGGDALTFYGEVHASNLALMRGDA